jgi:hypothetical protein
VQGKVPPELGMSLDKLGSFIAAKGTDHEVNDVRTSVEEYCASKLEEMTSRPNAFKEAFSSLLALLPEPDAEPNPPGLCIAMEALFRLSVSQSGPAVRVRNSELPEDGGPTFGVLILGFGGSGLLEMEPVDTVYARLRPSWRTVVTNFSALVGEHALRVLLEQQAQVAEALSDIDHVFVHIMSNNGYGSWQRLAYQNPALASKVRGYVYDCAVMVGGGLGEREWFHVFSQTVTGVMVMASAIPGGIKNIGPAKQRIEVASRALAQAGSFERTGDSFDELHELQLKHEAPVPSLCLTSPADPVVPETSVRAYAAALREAAPSRDVRVVSLSGKHCNLAISDREQYAAAVEALLDRGTYVHLASPAGAQGLCSFGLTMREQMIRGYEERLRARGEPLPSAADASPQSTAIDDPKVPKVDSCDDLTVSGPALTPSTAAVCVDGGKEAPEKTVASSEEWSRFFETYELSRALDGVSLAIQLQDALDTLTSGGRVALLDTLKAAGVGALPQRQKLANALGKEMRSRASAEPQPLW